MSAKFSALFQQHQRKLAFQGPFFLFIHNVLVLELLMRLVMEDMGFDKDDKEVVRGILEVSQELRSFCSDSKQTEETPLCSMHQTSSSDDNLDSDVFCQGQYACSHTPAPNVQNMFLCSCNAAAFRCKPPYIACLAVVAPSGDNSSLGSCH